MTNTPSPSALGVLWAEHEFNGTEIPQNLRDMVAALDKLPDDEDTWTWLSDWKAEHPGEAFHTTDYRTFEDAVEETLEQLYQAHPERKRRSAMQELLDIEQEGFFMSSSEREQMWPGLW